MTGSKVGKERPEAVSKHKDCGLGGVLKKKKERKTK